MAVLGLRFCARAFSICGERGPLFIAVRGPLIIAGLSCWRSTGSRRADSVVVAHGPSCSAACGIFPDQGSSPCPLHWQADPQPLRHQGSPAKLLFSFFLTSVYGTSFHSDIQDKNPAIVLLPPFPILPVLYLENTCSVHFSLYPLISLVSKLPLSYVSSYLNYYDRLLTIL